MLLLFVIKEMVSRRTVRRCIYLLLFSTFLTGMLTGIYLISAENNEDGIKLEKSQWLNTDINRDQKWFGLGGSQLIQKLRPLSNSSGSKINISASDWGAHHMEERKIEPFRSSANLSMENSVSKKDVAVNYNVHIFYYMWYGNPKQDGQYYHWNHNRIPHWDTVEAKRWPTHRHQPPDDIGANFYPELGAYSSQDAEVMENHMQQIQQAGAGVLAVSWYPPSESDDNGVPWDRYIPQLMDIAHKYLLKVCFHIEPFKDRTASSVKHWVQYIIHTYGSHPAFYRYKSGERYLPLFYMYDSYQVDPAEWSILLGPDTEKSIRGTELDAIFIGLLLESKHKQELKRAGFDGFYTYFASTGFSYGSTPSAWNMIARDARKSDMLFIPSVGPGYIDDRVRPWNKRNTKPRDRGKYYEHMFQAAIEANPSIVSITSFNEWHEGSQIETAIPKTHKDFTYLDYKPNGTDFYLKLTRKYVQQLRNT